MIEMTLDLAEKIVRAAHVKAKDLGALMGVSVVDESGRLVLVVCEGMRCLAPITEFEALCERLAQSQLVGP